MPPVVGPAGITIMRGYEKKESGTPKGAVP
jgi:hypothetical protein